MKFRKVIVFLLCAILAFSLVACGKDGTDEDGNGSGGGGGVSPNTEVTVTFDVGAEAREAGVANPESKTVNKGDTIKLPTPVWAEHTLEGWFSGTTKYSNTTKIQSSVKLTARWSSDREASEYEAGLSQWSEPGHLYIHYKRYAHDGNEETVKNTGAPKYSTAIDSAVYGDWCAWVWPKGDNGRCFNASKVDKSGAVYDIDLNATVYDDAGWDGTKKVPLNVDVDYSKATTIGFQLFSYKSRTEGTGFWANDGGDNDLVLADIARGSGSNAYYHWFVSQGVVMQGSKSLSSKPMVDPYKDKATGSMVTRKDGDGMIENSSENNSSRFPMPSSKPAGYEDAGVGYQIFIASFCDSNGDGIGDLQGIISKLDYLKSLNVDVLWLTPFQSSTNYHGYDIKDYFSVDSRFGTLADYRELVYKVHEKGMKIVMDFVLNHTSKSNPWFVKSQNLVIEDKATGEEIASDPLDGSAIDYRQFYSWINKATYNKITKGQKEEDIQWYGPLNGNGSADDGYYFYSSFSSDMPELNYDYQPVRDAIIDVCNYWMEFGLDGFRLDAVKHIYMKNEVSGLGKTPSTGNIDEGKGCVEDSDPCYSYDLARNLNFYREFNCRLKKNYPGAFLVGENLDGNPRNVSNFFQGLDSQFNFNLYYDASRAIAASYQYNSGYANSLTKKYDEAVYGNSYSLNGQNVNVKGYKTVNPNFIDGLYTSNHDLPRARDRMNITTDSAAQVDTYHKVKAADADKTEKMLRQYYAYIMTIPGLNWIYYGDEIGMSGLMPMSDGKTSTASKDATPHEDRIYRQPMKWFTQLDKNASYAIGYNDFKNELVDLNATNSVKGVDDQEKDSNSLLSWMKTLTKIRHENKALISGSIAKMTTQNSVEGSTVMYTVTKGSEKINVYLNVGDYDFSSVKGTVLASYNYSGNKLSKYGVAITKG